MKNASKSQLNMSDSPLQSCCKQQCRDAVRRPGILLFTAIRLLRIKLSVDCERQHHPTQFLPVNFLFEEIQAAKAAGRYLNYVRSLIKAKVLILDDLGLRNYTHEEATSLIDILEERYHKAPLIVTSQVEPQGWLKLFEDPVIGEAIVDRLIHPAQKITLKGEKSYREKLSEKKAGLKN